MLINFKCNTIEKILDTHKFWNQIRLNWENIIDQCYRKCVRNRTLCLYWNVSSTRSTLITVFKILVPLIGLSFSNPRHRPTFNFVPLYLSTSKILYCLPIYYTCWLSPLLECCLKSLKLLVSIVHWYIPRL